MAEAVIAYDRDLPEIPDRRPWEPPTSYLVKDEGAPTGWRVDDTNRRPSRLLLPPKIRAAVDAWRDGGYAGASEVTRRLFAYWFDEDHEVVGFDAPFRYYFCQREAIETLAWLVDIAEQRDVKTLIEAHGAVYQKDLVSQNVEFQTAMDGRRQLRRYVPELDKDDVQDLPPENLRRFAFKMATGSGKTWVMAMAVVWSRFHRQRVPGSDLSTNFLIVAPNVIVYQRLEKDFAHNRIFNELPLIPPGMEGQLLAEGDPARRCCGARSIRESLPHQRPPALRVARAGVDASERGRGDPGAEAGAGPCGLRPALHAGPGEVARRPRRDERRSPPRSRRGAGLEPVAARRPRRSTRWPRCVARLFGHPEGPERRTFRGRWWTIRWPKRWRTASSRRR